MGKGGGYLFGGTIAAADPFQDLYPGPKGRDSCLGWVQGIPKLGRKTVRHRLSFALAGFARARDFLGEVGVG